jgi:hypothetical protein
MSTFGASDPGKYDHRRRSRIHLGCTLGSDHARVDLEEIDPEVGAPGIGRHAGGRESKRKAVLG